MNVMLFGSTGYVGKAFKTEFENVHRENSQFYLHCSESRLEQTSRLQKEIQDHRITHIVNCAWPLKGDYRNSPENLKFTKSILSFCDEINGKIDFFLTLGSFSETLPNLETNEVLDNSPYAVSKRILRDEFRNLDKKTRTKFLYLTIGAPFGGREKEGRLFPYLLKVITENSTPVFRNPDYKLPLIHIQYLAREMIRATCKSINIQSDVSHEVLFQFEESPKTLYSKMMEVYQSRLCNYDAKDLDENWNLKQILSWEIAKFLSEEGVK